jgi:hypothetical protein
MGPLTTEPANESPIESSTAEPSAAALSNVKALPSECSVEDNNEIREGNVKVLAEWRAGRKRIRVVFVAIIGGQYRKIGICGILEGCRVYTRGEIGRQLRRTSATYVK